MVTVRSEGILWDLKEHCIYDTDVLDWLKVKIDVEEWKNKYIDLYQKWLEEEDETIYDIKSKINMDMIQSLAWLNQQNHGVTVFYWFDVDKYPDYVWQLCPLTGEPLIDFPRSSHENNVKISPRFPLIFPEVSF